MSQNARKKVHHVDSWGKKFLSHSLRVGRCQHLTEFLTSVNTVASTHPQWMAQNFFSWRVHAVDFFSSILGHTTVLTRPKTLCLQFLLGWPYSCPDYIREWHYPPPLTTYDSVREHLRKHLFAKAYMCESVRLQKRASAKACATESGCLA